MGGLKHLFNKYKIEFLSSILLFTYAINNAPSITQLHSWAVTSYLVSYRFGLISRGLVGTILELLFPKISVQQLYVFLWLLIISLILLFSLFIGKIIRSVNNETGDYIYVFYAIFLVNPGSIAYLFNVSNFVRLDIFLILITLLCIVLIAENKFLVLIPVLCGIAALIHQVFIFLYFPTIVLIFSYSLLSLKISFKKIFSLMASIILTAVIGIYIQFFSQINIDSQSSLQKIIHSKSENIPISGPMLFFEYYGSYVDHIEKMVQPKIAEILWIALIEIILLIPLIILFINLWINLLHHEERTNTKIVLLFMATNFIFMVPIFITTIDYGRWFASIIICQFLLISYFLMVKQKGVINLFLEKSKKPKLFLWIFIAFYLSALGKFEVYNFSIARRIYAQILSFFT